MAIKRIVADIATTKVEEMRDFYVDLFDLDIVMDRGWIVTLSTNVMGPVQLSIASEGGSGAPVPDMSIEVDDIEAIFARAEGMAANIVYPLTTEPWNVRRFYVSDPSGKIVNVMMHLNKG